MISLADKLTQKQENFVQGLFKGLSQADAYKAAFNAAKMKDDTIYPKASELAKRGKIAARLKELRDKVTEANIWPKLEMLRDLKAISEECKAENITVSAGGKEIKKANLRARNVSINAIHTAADILGYKKEKVEHEIGEKLEAFLKKVDAKLDY